MHVCGNVWVHVCGIWAAPRRWPACLAPPSLAFLFDEITFVPVLILYCSELPYFMHPLVRFVC